MKAAIVKAKGNVIVEEIPEPVVGEYDALCTVVATGVCNGTDNNIVNDDPYHHVRFPAVLGHEGIGKIISLGKNVRHLKVGDLVSRVFQKLPENSGYQILYGAFAERAIVTDWQAMKEDGLPELEYGKFRVHRVLPKNFDPIESTLIITWRETWAYLGRMKPRPGENILIIGTGGNALAFLDHAKKIGMSAGVIGSPDCKEKFIKKGANFFISYKEKKLPGILERKGKHFDIILDVVGEKKTLDKTLHMLKPGGKIGVYGLDKFYEYKTGPQDFSFWSGEEYDEASAHDDIINFIKQKKLNAWDDITICHSIPDEKINMAPATGEERKVLKSVVVFNSIAET